MGKFSGCKDNENNECYGYLGAVICFGIGVSCLVVGFIDLEKFNDYKSKETQEECYLIWKEEDTCKYECPGTQSCVGHTYEYEVIIPWKCGVNTSLIWENEGDCEEEEYNWEIGDNRTCYVADCNQFSLIHSSKKEGEYIAVIVMGFVFLCLCACFFGCYFKVNKYLKQEKEMKDKKRKNQMQYEKRYY